MTEMPYKKLSNNRSFHFPLPELRTHLRQGMTCSIKNSRGHILTILYLEARIKRKEGKEGIAILLLFTPPHAVIMKY